MTKTAKSIFEFCRFFYSYKKYLLFFFTKIYYGLKN